MKRLSLHVSIFILLSLHLFSLCADPLLVIVLMVKDEERVIQETLEPYLKVDPLGKKMAYVVYDTGSTDRTIEKTYELFARYPECTLIIGQEPFVNFSASRNSALRFAEQKFPDAVFLAMPDAEWQINNLPLLLDLCAEQRNAPTNVYSILIKTHGMHFFLPRLIRAHKNLCFKAPVHEYLDTNEVVVKFPDTIYFVYPDTPKGYEKSRARWYRDIDLLLEEYLINPGDPRTIFYLAQSYDCVGNLEMAHKFYLMRTHYSGFEEEDYMSFFRLGRVTEILSGVNQNYKWSDALAYYLSAYMKRPTRAEPLVLIAGHYLAVGQNELAFLYAALSCRIPFPEMDILFVERNHYDHIRYEIFARAALLIDLKFSNKILQYALAQNPDVPQERFILLQAFGGA